MGGRKEMKAAPRALRLQGLMNHACIRDADVMRDIGERKRRRPSDGYGAGCLTCESENTRRERYAPPSFRTPRSGDPESRRKFGICIWIPGSRLTARPGMTAPLLPRLDLGPQPVGEPRDALVARG